MCTESDVSSCVDFMSIFWHSVTDTFLISHLSEQKVYFLPGSSAILHSRIAKGRKKGDLCNSLWIELLLYYPPDTLRFINQRHCFSLKTPSSVREFGAKNLTYGGKRRLCPPRKQPRALRGLLFMGRRSRELERQRKREKTCLRLMTLFWSHFSFDGEFVWYLSFSTANLDAR